MANINIDFNTISSNIGSLDKEEREHSYFGRDILVLRDLRDIKGFGTVKMGMNVILLCRKGVMQLEINGRSHVIHEREMLIVQSNVLVKDTMISPDFQCYVTCLTDRIVKTQLHSHIYIWNQALYVNNVHIVKLHEELTFEQIDHFYELLLSFFNMSRKTFQNEIVASIVRCLLLDLCAMLKEELHISDGWGSSAGEQIFNDFLRLLSESEVKYHSVDYYASQLCVSPKYLSSVCKRIGNKSALQWIHEYVLEDVKYYLLESQMSIKEIGAKLGFSNLTVFGKYVKKHLGQSPKSIRKCRDEE